MISFFVIPNPREYRRGEGSPDRNREEKNHDDKRCGIIFSVIKKTKIMDRNQDDKNRANKQDDRDLPGYPHYPPEEDIMNPQSGFKKISADDELANSKSLSSRSINIKPGEPNENPRNEDEDIRIVRGTEADVTKDDLQLLGPRDGDLDAGDDELVSNARVDEVANEDDLDIPGADLDDDEEELGEEDEENNYYSLGGDRHENLEEDQSFEDKDQDQS